ncbi:MAG: CaiB/BaiF CoA-transferase family protein [Pseudomonadota bacterium]|nr:CaiB/BaiF CoA-transferase family protein [Pseudomonadota bacterium]
MMKDLEGITVVALEQAVAAPYASSRLADAGARVIKIEREEGDFARRYDSLVNGDSAYFVWLNRGKESVCLNLKDEADKSLLGAMIASADVFIQNLAPGAVERMGFAPDALLAQHPSLICCSITGYGRDGPYSQQKAYDLLVQAESGLCAVNGTEHGAARVGVSVCDIAAGMQSFQGIMQALYGRTRTGKGRIIDVSLYHALADWMNVPYLQTRYGGKPPARVGLRHPTIAPYGAYVCGDDKAVLISIQNEREWVRLASEVLGDSGIATDPRFESNNQRVANRQALEDIIAGVFGSAPREAIIEQLNNAGIAFGRLTDLEELAAHPQNRFITVQSDGGEIELMAPGFATRGETPYYGPVPSLGQHSDAIRAEFGTSHDKDAN